MNENVQLVFEQRPRRLKKILIIGIPLFLILAWSWSYVDYNGIEENGLRVIQSIFSGLIKPNQKMLFSFGRGSIPQLVLETVTIAFLGTLLGMILAIPFSFLSARNIVPKWFSAIGIFIITVIRTFPPFVYGLLIIVVTGAGPFAGVLTLALTSIGMISKLFIEAIEDLDEGIIESLDASGSSNFQKIRFGIIPQLFGNFLSIAIYRFEINVKNATILGLVDAGGIGTPLVMAMSAFRWADVGAILWGLIILVVFVEWLSSALRAKVAG